MLTLFQPPGAWGLPSISPFCVKLEAYLRLCKIPYVAKPGDPRSAPKGKVPYIDDDGKILGDSQLIIEYLKSKHGDTLDQALDEGQRATGHMVRRTLEEATYWSMVYVRWMDPSGWEETRRVFLKMLPMPPFLASLVLNNVIKKNLKNALHGQGTGRHSQRDIVEMAQADYSALATVLGDKPFLLGSEPTSFDCTVYAFVEGALRFPVESSVKSHVLGLKSLVDYAARFKERAFADWTPTVML